MHYEQYRELPQISLELSSANSQYVEGEGRRSASAQEKVDQNLYIDLADKQINASEMRHQEFSHPHSRAV